MEHRSRGTGVGRFAALAAGVLILVSACGTAASPSTGGGGGGGSSGAPAGTKHVSIVNQDMTDDQIKAAIQKEGSVVVGNWTYSANAVLIDQFQKYVKSTYGVDITLT